MQLTIDDRAARAEKLILRLEDMGYHFKPAGNSYSFYGPADIIGSALLCELSRYRKEANKYLSDRGRINCRRCKEAINGNL